VTLLVARVAWYRFRATLRARAAGYLTLVGLVGVLGGMALAAVASARRTQSSFPSYLASTNPSDIGLITGAWDPSINSTGYNPSLVDTITHLPHVKHVESYLGLNVQLITAGDSPVVIPVQLNDTLGSLDGLLLDQDRVTVTTGRLPDPARADEVVMTATVADGLGLHVGSVLHMGFYDMADFNLPGFGTASVPPRARIDVTLVGIVLFADKVVPDDVDLVNREEDIIFTPAVTRQFEDCCAYLSASSLLLEHGSRDVVAVEAEIQQVLPANLPHLFTTSATSASKAERAIKPLSVALGVFGCIAGLATLLIASQVIGRQLRLAGNDRSSLRALGATPAMTSTDGLVGVLGAVVVGSVLAFAVAVGLSPLAPLGPVRRVNPTPGINVDWAVLGLGMLVSIIALTVVAVVGAIREASERVARRQERIREHGSRICRAATVSGLPVPAVLGIRFAVDPSVRRNTVPVRSAILSATLAMVVITGTVTFGASMQTLVSHPALYGWNWDFELSSGANDIPVDTATRLLNQDPDVAAWTGVYFAALVMDGLTVPVIGGSPNAPVGPPILSGHGFDATDEVVLGASTLARLRKRVGDTVEVSYSSGTHTTLLRIVGTATMPTIGGGVHPTMGTGAWLDDQLIPVAIRNPFGGQPATAGPNAIFIRLRDGASKAAALQRFGQLVKALPSSNSFGLQVDVVPLQRPAEIVIYGSMAGTLLSLGAGLAVGAIAALGLTLVASIRRHQRDLAMFKALGLAPRQIAAVVAWQSTVAVVIGTLLGVPIGIIIGRTLWRLFANALHAVPQPTVPILPIALIAIGAFAVANLVAAIPGRTASRTSTAVLLRVE
jgi:hypothetical protein